MPVSKSLRFEVLRRDQFTCRYCGSKAPDVQLHVDHVVPAALGGPDTPENLVTACVDCNAGKANRSLDEDTVSDIAEDVEKWQKAKDLAAQKRQNTIKNVAAVGEYFLSVWPQHLDYSLPFNYPKIVYNYIAQGISQDEIEHLVSVAVNSNAPAGRKFQYFCGCCRNVIREIEDSARTIEGGANDEGFCSD